MSNHKLFTSYWRWRRKQKQMKLFYEPNQGTSEVFATAGGKYFGVWDVDRKIGAMFEDHIEFRQWYEYVWRIGK